MTRGWTRGQALSASHLRFGVTIFYLRHRVTLANTATCACPDLDVTGPEDLRRGQRAFVKGYTDGCPIHGVDGTEPYYQRVEL
jgi:hypothetical protein